MLVRIATLLCILEYRVLCVLDVGSLTFHCFVNTDATPLTDSQSMRGTVILLSLIDRQQSKTAKENSKVGVRVPVSTTSIYQEAKISLTFSDYNDAKKITKTVIKNKRKIPMLQQLLQVTTAKPQAKINLELKTIAQHFG